MESQFFSPIHSIRPDLSRFECLTIRRIGKFYVVQKSRATDFAALKLGKGRWGRGGKRATRPERFDPARRLFFPKDRREKGISADLNGDRRPKRTKPKARKNWQSSKSADFWIFFALLYASTRPVVAEITSKTPSWYKLNLSSSPRSHSTVVVNAGKN